ncbi:5-formyltetrahydrofolate cyclo-ligase [Shewanella rhizosphaerae]|uniref:5-formyltetrahydrofolate cyclo-ligase n=1 Tax=Shewanella rhizosphaerae TaxID=2864207 RepID=UPI001C65CB12|nr:5-formyltetrahydrofolate cyclo-ligase [Shewanella rhizosphaerae]QYK12208.1 5-formyltetrahydrofolate cyclo-ligase [Shewanella rhizosphaerae]
MKPALTPSTANQENRQAIRNQIRSARRALPEQTQKQFAQEAASRLMAVINQRQAKHVALYLTSDGELDTQPLIETLWQEGVNVYLPRLHPFSLGNLLFFKYHPTSHLIQNRLKIWEPKLNITEMILPQHLDVIITPLVAFDEKGNRMGMGGGYYDRCLSDWQLRGKPYPIGYAHDCQRVESLPTEHWDVPLPMIVTPSATHTS